MHDRQDADPSHKKTVEESSRKSQEYHENSEHHAQ
ncbi:MAG: hypothetical protein ACI9Y1_003156 [Lentisphaeria bacterium]|jgi:hypothetical protein